MRTDDDVRRFADGAEPYRPNGGGEAAPGPIVSLRPIDLTAWHGKPIPPRRWLVRDWIPWGSVTALYGDGGLGKSLLAQQLMTACATEKHWLGVETTPCPSVGLLCEDEEDELLRRQDCINRAFATDFCALGHMHIIPRVGEDNVLMTFDRGGKGTLTPLWLALVAETKRRNARLAVIDTAADTFGGDELRRSEVRQFIASCLARLARDIEGSVLLLAHPSLSGMASGTGSGGSTAWNNTVRSRLYLSQRDAKNDDQPDDDARVLTTKKANYAATGSEIKLRWQHGAFVREGAPAAGLVAAVERKNADAECDAAFLSCLEAVAKSGRYASATANSPSYAPKIFLRLDARRGFNKKQLERAMERLFAANRIRVELVKTAHRNAVATIVKVASL